MNNSFFFKKLLFTNVCISFYYAEIQSFKKYLLQHINGTALDERVVVSLHNWIKKCLQNIYKTVKLLVAFLADILGRINSSFIHSQKNVKFFLSVSHNWHHLATLFSSSSGIWVVFSNLLSLRKKFARNKCNNISLKK